MCRQCSYTVLQIMLQRPTTIFTTKFDTELHSKIFLQNDKQQKIDIKINLISHSKALGEAMKLGFNADIASLASSNEHLA